jgi:hypothetical protein
MCMHAPARHHHKKIFVNPYYVVRTVSWFLGCFLGRARLRTVYYT